MQFRVQFLDAWGVFLKELYIDVQSLAGAIALFDRPDWPPRAAKMVIVDDAGGEVHSERQ